MFNLQIRKVPFVMGLMRSQIPVLSEEGVMSCHHMRSGRLCVRWHSITFTLFCSILSVVGTWTRLLCPEVITDVRSILYCFNQWGRFNLLACSGILWQNRWSCKWVLLISLWHNHLIRLQICRKICGLVCVTRTLVHAWFTQPCPHIFLHFCTEIG